MRWKQRQVFLGADPRRVCDERPNGRRLLRVQNRSGAAIYLMVGEPGDEAECFEVADGATFDLRDPAPECAVYGRAAADAAIIVLEG